MFALLLSLLFDLNVVLATVCSDNKPCLHGECITTTDFTKCFVVNGTLVCNTYCICESSYITYPSNTTVNCNYKQISGVNAFLLEFFIGPMTGAGYFYIGQTVLGVCQLLFFWTMVSGCCLGFVCKPKHIGENHCLGYLAKIDEDDYYNPEDQNYMLDVLDGSYVPNNNLIVEKRRKVIIRNLQFISILMGVGAFVWWIVATSMISMGAYHDSNGAPFYKGDKSEDHIP